MLFPGKALIPLLQKALIPLLRDCLIHCSPFYSCSFLEKGFNSLLRDCLIHLHALSWRKHSSPLIPFSFRDALIVSFTVFILFPGKALIPLLRDCLIHFTCSFLESHSKALEKFPLLRDCLIHFTSSFLEKKLFNSYPSLTVSFILHALSWRKALIPLLRFNSSHIVIVSFIFTCSFLRKRHFTYSFLLLSLTVSFILHALS
ncbi:unnamed protein product [Acanthosepion pharaonis]|uniref:Uncharacterized protein n=1 Tax=Acanthosepion pharaonis TaxID=158019 RepID=A0A812CBN7_ACAPH|nr:unnamed protein product [Sepia pharaonis]